ncbi:MAG: hydroxymethylglutaryl-CoA reductase, degradative [Thermoplasmata archaeon]
MVNEDSGFHNFKNLSPKQRLEIIAKNSSLSDEDIKILSTFGSLDGEKAGSIIENVFSTLEIPVGLATNFIVNGKRYLVPMAVEESSIVAACSYAAKIAASSGGFTAHSSSPVMIGQIQLTDVSNRERSTIEILKNEEKILEMANSRSKTLKSLGAGAIKLDVRIIEELPDQLIVHLLVDVRDAMGANVVNTMCEHIAPYLGEITGTTPILRILSNLSDQRMAYSWATFPSDLIGGPEIAERIIKAYQLARYDPYRAATHNKGIMNGIDAVLLATLNDWRAVESGAHAFAARSGRYSSLTSYSLSENGDITGSIAIPIAVGTVGGSTASIDKARIMRKILNVGDSAELASVLASVGLAQNFAALRALSSEGIQKGHMKLHSKNVAISAGATGDEINAVSSRMVEERNVSFSRAREILEELRSRNKN